MSDQTPCAVYGEKGSLSGLSTGTRLRAGHRIKGPAIVEEPFTMIVVYPRQSATLERNGNDRIEITY